MAHHTDHAKDGAANPVPIQSRFDLQLDRWSKIATILIGLLGLLVTTYVTVWVVPPGDKMISRHVNQANSSLSRSFE